MQIKINKIFDYAAIASGLVLFSLAILTFCDVFGRRFLNSPVAGTIELVEFGMALVAFLAMPRAFFFECTCIGRFHKKCNKWKIRDVYNGSEIYFNAYNNVFYGIWNHIRSFSVFKK